MKKDKIIEMLEDIVDRLQKVPDPIPRTWYRYKGELDTYPISLYIKDKYIKKLIQD